MGPALTIAVPLVRLVSALVDLTTYESLQALPVAVEILTDFTHIVATVLVVQGVWWYTVIFKGKAYLTLFFSSASCPGARA